MTYVVSISNEILMFKHSISYTLTWHCVLQVFQLSKLYEKLIELLDDWVCHDMLHCVKDYKKENFFFWGGGVKKILYLAKFLLKYL